MPKSHVLIAPYREEEPGAEAPGAAGGEPPEASQPNSAETPDAPEDHGNDTVPEESSLWESLADEISSEDSDEETPVPEKVEEPAEEPEPEPEPETPTPVEEPEPEPEPTPEPEPEPQPAEEPLKEETDEERMARKQKFVSALEAQFQITEAQALELQMEPKTAYPKLMATIMADMYEGIMASVQQQLPQAFSAYTAEKTAQDTATKRFFEAWPKLNQQEHGNAVKRVASVYAQLNEGKTLDEETVVRDVGLQVMAMYGIQPDLVVQGDESVRNPPPAPRVPPKVTSAPAAQTQSGNIWETMAEELLDDEM